MNKNTIGIILIIILMGIIGVISLILVNNKKIDNNDEQKDNRQDTSINQPEDDLNSNKKDNDDSNSKKILIVYYSASNNTKGVAGKLANNLKADLFAIVPENIYTEDDLDWTNSNSRVSKEHNDEELRNVKLKNTKVDNWESYDIVLIGYPIWWGIAAWPIDTFVTSNNFSGKTVIPFCTSASSSIGESGKLLAKKSGSGTWLDGYRFSSTPSDEDIKNFIESIK